MTCCEALGRRVGFILGAIVDPLLGDRIRAAYASRFGACRVCASPLGGSSPGQVCEGCHAGEVLRQGLGGKGSGEA